MFSILFITLATIYCHASTDTEYPLYAIISHNTNTFPTSDIKLIAENFNAAQVSFNLTTAKQIHSFNSNFKITHYRNTWSTDELQTAEYNKTIPLRYPFATLTSSLTNSASDTAIHLKLLSHFTKIPLTQSTTSSQYSSSCTQYVSWIRIDDEFMKVTKIDSSQLTVQRGFVGNGKSTPTLTSHAANAKIFAPVYATNAPGTSGCTNKFTYSVNPESEYAITRWANFTYSDVQNGADGSWYDCFASNSFKAVDGIGTSLTDSLLWDDNHNDYFTDCNNYRIAEQNRLEGIYNLLSSKYKIAPDAVTIFANDMFNGGYFNCGLGKMLAADPPSFPNPLDGYCIEAYALHETGDCEHSEIAWITVGEWINNVNEFMNASSLDLAAMPMIAQAGCKSPALEKLDEKTYQQVILFGYSTFLMGVRGRNGKGMFGVPAMRTVNNKTYAYIDEVFFYKIGDPTETKSNVDGYKINGHISYQRSFANGIVIVNPDNKTDDGVSLSKNYINPQTNKTVNKLNVDALTAYILLNE